MKNKDAGSLKRKARRPTDYEAQQVREVASWKSRPPNPFAELFRWVVRPIAKGVETLIPDPLGLAAVDAAYRASDVLATQADVKRRAGVGDVRDLQRKPLELCDELATSVGRSASTLAAVEGFATGAGGVWTTLIDIPLLFVLSLRTIIKIGHCYGYPLDRPADEAWVLGAFAVALSATPERRAKLMERLRETEDLLVEETQEQVLIEEAASLVTQIEVFESVPVFGAATGALLNLSMINRVDVTARRLFQERWLKDNDCVDLIEPLVRLESGCDVVKRPGAFVNAAAAAAYGLSFGATFPIYLAADGLSGLVGRRTNAATA